MNMLELYKRIRKDMRKAEREADQELHWTTPMLQRIMRKHYSAPNFDAVFFMYIGRALGLYLRRRRERKQLSFHLEFAQ